MNTLSKAILPVVASVILCSAYAQGDYQYDQQSANESIFTGSWLNIQTNQPIGQSFTPSLSSVGFIRLNFTDFSPGNSLGATVYVNLRSDSITGSVLGSTDPVFIPNGIGVGAPGYITFFFPIPVSVTPGTLYYFQPVLLSGEGALAVGAYHFNYAGGTAFVQGAPHSNSLYDLWFREGTVVPEPSSSSLTALGGGLVLLFCRKKKPRP